MTKLKPVNQAQVSGAMQHSGTWGIINEKEKVFVKICSLFEICMFLKKCMKTWGFYVHRNFLCKSAKSIKNWEKKMSKTVKIHRFWGFSRNLCKFGMNIRKWYLYLFLVCILNRTLCKFGMKLCIFIRNKIWYEIMHFCWQNMLFWLDFYIFPILR